jgi:cbb3-type cytochrome oxidase subunit 3
MDHLAFYSSVAEIFSALTIVIGAVFAGVQYSQYRKRERNRIAGDLCARFSEPEFARAIALLRRMPDGVDMKTMQSMDVEYEEAAQIVGMMFETMGLLVFTDVASFKLIQELTGGLLLMMWRKLETWIKTTRIEQGNPRFGEWVQWLAERIAEEEAGMVPAYNAHAQVKKLH